MTFLPIVGRELRAASRRRNTYWTRLFIALAATVAGTWIYGFSSRMPPQQVAQYTFIGLSVLALGYCLVSGRLFTADCLSGEKREGTLGLLFLTDLKGYDVVIGKLAATSLRGLYGLLAVLPVLAIPLLLGGVSWGEFWRIALVLVNTFFFSLGAGIFVSALSRDARRAFGANFTVMLLLIALPPACAGVIYFSTARYLIPPLLYSCPVYSFWLCFESGPSFLQAHHFWWSVGTVHALSWMLVLSTSWIVPHCWQDRPSGTAKIRWRDRWQSWSYGNDATRKRSESGCWTSTRFIGWPRASGSNLRSFGAFCYSWPAGGCMCP
jgi:ABC-type transport system involved in cytochrome c biogenesis permease component